MVNQIWADLHTHTVACGHAFSTIKEMASAAAGRGLGCIAITEHGPAIPSGAHPYWFGSAHRVPREIDGVQVLVGIEANITGLDGHLDLASEKLNRLDLVLAGFHQHTGYEGANRTEHTRAVINCMRRQPVQIISHPFNREYPLHSQLVVEAAVENGVALELNNSSLSRQGSGRQVDAKMVDECLTAIRELGAWYALGSDAHIDNEVGIVDRAAALAEMYDLDPARCVNHSRETLGDFLNDNASKKQVQPPSLTALRVLK